MPMSNEMCGRLDGNGWKRRNIKVAKPAEKVIWNHFRFSEDLGKLYSCPTAYDEYRSGFLEALQPPKIKEYRKRVHDQHARR